MQVSIGMLLLRMKLTLEIQTHAYPLSLASDEHFWAPGCLTLFPCSTMSARCDQAEWYVHLASIMSQ